jgi:predicted nucleic acid-binding protein
LNCAANAGNLKGAGNADLPGWFFDTSALAKLYHSETGSGRVESIVNITPNRVWISRLTLMELPSAFAIKVRTGFLPREDASVLLRRFRADLSSSRFDVYPIREEEFAMAGALIDRHSFHLGLRTLDAIQLAAALRVRSFDLVEYFVASDRLLCRVAALEGFSVINPEDE